MESFLRNTAKSVLEHIGWEHLRQATLVLPSRRAGLVLKDELLRLQQSAGRKAVYAPQVQTLNQFIDSLSPLYAEDELATIARLYRLYRKSAISNHQSQMSDIMPLDLFYGWGRQMLSDFTNIDSSMPADEVPSFFANAVSAHELGEWQLDEETENRLRLLLQPTAGLITAEDRSIRAQYEALWHSLSDIYTRLRSEMIEAGKGYTGLRARRVVEEWDSILPTLRGRQFVFVGFNYLLPVEKQIMSLLRDAGQASFYWDYISDFRANSKAFYFTERNQADLGSRSAERQWGNPREVNLIACSSRAAQAQYVNEWLPMHYTQAGQRIGVVICDENMLEPVIYALPALSAADENGEICNTMVNVTKGFPLRNTRPFAVVLRAAEQWTDTIDWDTLIDALDKEEQSPITNEQSPITWHELLHREASFQVRTCINKLRRLVNEGIEGVVFTPKLTRMLLRRQMESVTMPFHGEPVTDVQVLGVLETRMLDFDSVLLLNVEEGVLPQQQHDNSFIPYYLRKYYHMQTSDERATVYAYNFFRLISRAEHVTLLYTPAETNPDSRGLSRFVWQMEASPEFILHRSRLIEASRVQNSDLYDESTKTCTLRRLSPSAINTYIACPRRFYWQYVEGLQPQEREDTLFATNTIGSFVHSVLQTVYRDECGCDSTKPVSVTAEQIRAVIDSDEKMHSALNKAYEAMNSLWAEHHPDDPQPHYLPEQHMIENKAILSYARNVLEHDAIIAETQGLQIWQLEKRRELKLDIDGIGAVSVGGIVDRIDIVGKGDNARVRIVDYKTGNYKSERMQTSWDELTNDADKAYILQTFLYSAAVAENLQRLTTNDQLPIQPNLYFCKKSINADETQLQIDKAVVEDFAPLSERFMSLLKSKIHELLTTTDFPQQTAKDECPQHCPFLLLCGRKC